MARTSYWFCKKRMKLIDYAEESPPQEPRYGKGPMIRMDQMTNPYRHPMTGRIVDTWSALEAENRKSNCSSLGAGEKVPKKSKDTKAIDKDWDHAIDRAIWAIDNGEAPLSEKTRELCRQHDETLGNTLGFDAANITGSKRGKKKGRIRKY